MGNIALDSPTRVMPGIHTLPHTHTYTHIDVCAGKRAKTKPEISYVAGQK